MYDNTNSNHYNKLENGIQGEESLTLLKKEFAIEIENTPKLGRKESINLETSQKDF